MATREVVFALRFTGRGGPAPGSATKRQARTVAPSQVWRTIIAPTGMSGTLETLPGESAVLESRVKGNLLQQMGRVAFSVEVEANGGIVSLTGHVPDELRHKLALQTAERVSGVKKLVDLIEIKP